MGKGADEKEIEKFVYKRFEHLGFTLLAKHKKWANFPHWYLAYVGVEPELQGAGHGSKLSRTVSAYADRDGVPCYTECTGQRNREYYEHLGYEVKEQVTLKVSGDEAGWEDSELFIMVRPPGAGAKEAWPKE